MRIKESLFLVSLLIIAVVAGIASAETISYEGKLIPDGISNESISSKGLIIDAQNCISGMEARGLKISRMNESLQQALQLYSAQIALEEKGSGAEYKLVNQSAVDVCNIRDVAFKAQDEFLVFNESYTNSLGQFNLSSMQGDYNGLIKSFDEERFEDSLKLIDKCYTDLSDLESSQTSFNLYYQTTTRTIKDFFVNNWKILSVWAIIIIVLLIIFWRAIKTWMLKTRLNNLYMRKKSINELIKKMQYSYFKTKTMSEIEYTVKLKTFDEMIRDIERQIPETEELLARTSKDIDGDVKSKAVKTNKVNEKIAGKFKSKVYKRRKTK